MKTMVPYYPIEKKDLIQIQESIDELRKEVQELKELLIMNQSTQPWIPSSDKQIFYTVCETPDKHWFEEPPYQITC